MPGLRLPLAPLCSSCLWCRPLAPVPQSPPPPFTPSRSANRCAGSADDAVLRRGRRGRRPNADLPGRHDSSSHADSGSAKREAFGEKWRGESRGGSVCLRFFLSWGSILGFLCHVSASHWGALSRCLTPISPAPVPYRQGIGGSEERLYKNTFDCIKKIWRLEGWQGYFKVLKRGCRWNGLWSEMATLYPPLRGI